MLQVRADWFGDLELPQPRALDKLHPTIVKAAKFMADLAEPYCTGEVDTVEALKIIRNSRLKELGIGSSKSSGKKTPMKKPAAATVAATGSGVQAPQPKAKAEGLSSKAPKPPVAAPFSSIVEPIPIGIEQFLHNLSEMSLE